MQTRSVDALSSRGSACKVPPMELFCGVLALFGGVECTLREPCRKLWCCCCGKVPPGDRCDSGRAGERDAR